MPDRAPYNILLLDDDPGILRLCCRTLERAGHAVVPTDNAESAQAILRAGEAPGQKRVDLIVLDYQLAGPTSGLDFFRALAARGSVPPAVLVTGFSDEGRVLEALRAGVRDVVRKTDDFLEHLPRTVERVLREVEAERKVVEAEAVIESEHRLRLALEAGRLGSWEVDVATGAVECSALCRSHFGFETTDRCHIDDLLDRVHPDDRDAARAAFAGTGGGPAVGGPAVGGSDVEFRTVASNGRERWVSARGRAIEAAGRRAARVIGVTLDLTARKAAEQELRAAKETAEAASRAKDHFLAVLSHELRTPLTPVLAIAHELAADPALPPHLRPQAEVVRRNVQLETKLVDDLLDLTKISRGKLVLTLRPTDLHEAVRAVVAMCEGEIKGKGLRLLLGLSAARHWVEADGARLQQVLWNLLKNAAKFTPDGGRIELTTADVDGPDGDRRVRVEVRDSGIGIEPGVLPRVFDAFEQGESTVTRQFGGLGLGLAISRALVQLHGGTIVAASDGANRGATFTVELATVAEPPAAKSNGAGGPAAAIAPAPTKGMSVLLVEDHFDTANALARLLKLFGHDVELADSVAAAIQATESRRFDVLVSDIGLPDGTGLDLMRHVRASRPVPGVVLSGFGMEEDVRRSLEAGFAAHLTKPVTPDELNDAIVRVGKA